MLAQRKWTNCLIVGAIFLLAFLLRVGVARISPNIYYPDEIFQTQEPAHHLVYGYGITSWEYRDGARSWVFPAVLAVVMRATAWMGHGPDGYLLGIAMVLSALSLVVVWFGFAMGYRIGGTPTAIVAGLACAFWYEFVYFGPKAFNEFAAGNLFLLALYLGITDPDSSAANISSRQTRFNWRLFAVAVLCGTVVGLRVHLLPAVFVALLYFFLRRPKSNLLPLAAGFLLTVLVFGAVDAFTWSYPFQSYVVNFTYNVIQQKANPKPWYSLVASLFLRTGPLPLLACLGARRSPFLACVALAILVPHSLIPHKEYRFIYPLLPILVLLAAVGLIDLLAFFNAKLKTQMRQPLLAAFATAFFLLLSASIAYKFPFWTEASGGLRAFKTISADQSVCGLAMPQAFWSHTGGYTYLHRDIPIYLLPDIANSAPMAPHFNALLSPEALPTPPNGFTLWQCWPGACLYRRAADCAKGLDNYTANEVLKTIGQ